MPTWVFFLGFEAITIVICVVATVIWMNHGEKGEDAYDRRLQELTQQDADIRAKVETH